MAGGWNGRNDCLLGIWHTNSSPLVFLTHISLGLLMLLRLPVKLVGLLNIFWFFILFCILNGSEVADRVDKALDQTLSHFLVSFPLSTSCWDLMWSQLTTPCLWLMTRDSPGVHVCANPKCRINAVRTEPHPMGDGYSWIKALPSVLWIPLRSWIYSLPDCPVTADLTMPPHVGYLSSPTPLLLAPSLP